MSTKIGIIGGSGFYNMEGVKDVKKVRIKTPFGDPSDEYVTGNLEGVDVVFLARHGKGHKVTPSELNYCANIYGMKKLGVERIISVSACGSLKKELKPLDIVIPDQFIDRTNQARRMTFFGDGIVAHIAFAEPVCKELSRTLYDAGKEVGATMHFGGTYINMEGPQFSTKSESKLYRSWGVDIIGMTNMGEAKVAREAEICYATLACITDYDCWHTCPERPVVSSVEPSRGVDESTESVTVELVIQNLFKNVDTSKKILRMAIKKLGGSRKCECGSALKDAIITRPEVIPAETKKKLEPIIGKYIK